MEDLKNILYKTVSQPGSAETEVLRSKFIANVAPVDSREEAEAFVKAIKEKYKDATHNVGTFVVGTKQEVQWTSDDGEPQGTSGPPILKMVTAMGLTNLVIVVTRYFGGTKLGTGGLVRAYSGAAKAALDAVGIVGATMMWKAPVEMEYGAYNKLTAANMLEGIDASISSVEYSGAVTFNLTVSEEHKNKAITIINNLTSGGGDSLSFKEELAFVNLEV